jgi:ATP-dependent Lon protease
VILPARNEADLDELPAEVRKEIEFHFAETVDDVLAASLEPFPSKNAGKKRKSAARSKKSENAQNSAN